MRSIVMPRWKKDAKEFTVAVDYSRQGNRVYMPEPIAQFLGKPDKITFKIEGKRVIVKN